MIPLLCALLATATPTELEQIPVADGGFVSSSNATYDGNTLTLTGDVQIDHGLGKMRAEEAYLEKQEAGKEFPFSHLDLRQSVALTLRNTAQLICERAQLDFITLKGMLTGKNDERVSYKDLLRNKSPFELLGQVIELNFAKKGHDGKKSDYEIETILAKADVLIKYAGNFFLSADHALYRKEQPRDQKSQGRQFQGIVTAYPKDQSTPCKLVHEGDLVEAETIDLDLVHSKLSLLHPRGTISSPRPISFQCEHLVWNHEQNQLLLKGKVAIKEQTLGIIHADEEISIVQAIIDGERTLQTIRSTGPTRMQIVPSALLVSYGTLLIDRPKLIATADSPSPEKQLHFQDKDLSVFADTALLEYSIVEDSLELSSLLLKGQIRLQTPDPSQPPRAALADKLSYSPTTDTIILTAKPGRKVLFWDSAQGLKISAHEVHITRDSETHQQQIKGIGAVQFALSSDETARLSQVFPSLKGSL